VTTIVDQNELVVRRFFDELWTRGRLEVADELMAPEHIHHLSGDDLGGPQEVKALVTFLRGAFPDLRFVIEDEVVAGDKVVVRWTAVGTHLGEFDGIPPSGRVVTWTGMDLVRLQDHRIVELWGNNDALGLREQLRS
jgi:predicted ester cyclase